MRISDWSSDVCSSDLASFDSVAEPLAAAAIVETAMQRFGRLDGVVNNAGILRDAIFHKMSVADFEAVIKVHLMGSFYVSHAAARIFREQESGAFVHFTSTSGLIGNVGQANYAAARSEEHTSELQSLMRISYAVFC